jgi:hypothetical protein
MSAAAQEDALLRLRDENMQLKRRAAAAEGENHRLLGERNVLREQLVKGPASEGACGRLRVSGPPRPAPPPCLS